MRRPALALSGLGCLWALGATVYVLTGGGLEGISTSFTLAGTAAEAGSDSVPLSSAAGVWVAGLLAGVTLVAGLPLGVALSNPGGQRATTWTAGLLLLGFSLVTGSTVGLFYLPCAVALVAAAITTGELGDGESGWDNREGAR